MTVRRPDRTKSKSTSPSNEYRDGFPSNEELLRDLTVYAVLSDMFVGRPAIYATFASYDEVAHHSGLERPDTLEALPKLDQQFGRIERARRYAPRPYEIVVLSDHGQTQGATFKQRNGYALEDLVRQSVEADDVRAESGEDESRTNVGVAFDEATGQGEESGKKRGGKKDVSGEEVVVLGSGNLGLVYLMEEKRRLTLEEIEIAHRATPRRRRRADSPRETRWRTTASEQFHSAASALFS